MKKSGIYLITCLESWTEYVGSTIQTLGKRWQQHKSELNRGKHSNKHLQNAWKLYGENAFVFEILETAEHGVGTKKQFSGYLLRLEDFYINQRSSLHPDGYNLLSADRHIVLEETRAKMSAASSKRKHSEETIAKMSLIQKNAPWKMDMSPEKRLECAVRAEGNNHDNKTWEIISPDDDVFVVSGLAGFCRENNLSASNLRNTAHGRRKHSKGWKARLISKKSS